MKNKLQAGKFLNLYVDISSTIDTVVLSSHNTSLYENLHYRWYYGVGPVWRRKSLNFSESCIRTAIMAIMDCTFLTCIALFCIVKRRPFASLFVLLGWEWVCNDHSCCYRIQIIDLPSVINCWKSLLDSIIDNILALILKYNMSGQQNQPDLCGFYDDSKSHSSV